MASSRKKQDEKNVKILRDLASLQHNKYCFDCNQRGPTYVNVTIGSFVCTKCSGILRGLTPPHRVKSISMATFTQEEVELLRTRGNDYCRRTWLGLYEGNTLSDHRDEQVVRDFMVDKYEKKRYYLDPSMALTNGVDAQPSIQPPPPAKPAPPVQSKLPQINGASNEKNNRNINGKINDFVADFGSADIYNAINANKDNNMNNGAATITQQPSFANFDNNLIFNSNSAPAFNSSPQQQFNTTAPVAPPVDRYAALKDLDNALKVQPQTQIDWNSGSNGSPYGSATPTSSVYSSPSPHGSMYGSPSQGQFASAFMQQDTTKVSNPFNGGGMIWGESVNQSTGVAANPFRTTNAKVNGVSSGFYTTSSFPASNGSPWVPNPFSMGSSASNGHSNNPFL